MIDSINETTVDEWEAIGSVYRLISRLLISEVDADFLSILNRIPQRDAFIELGGVLPKSNDSDTIDDLAADYCRLIIGPSGHFPPYQSVWEHGQFQSQTIESMQSYSGIVRYTPSEAVGQMMLDHLGIQLDLMAHILTQIPTVSSASDRESVIEIASAFSIDHLQWADSMLSAASDKAQTDFYQSAMKLIAQFLDSEKEFWNKTGQQNRAE